MAFESIICILDLAGVDWSASITWPPWIGSLFMLRGRAAHISEAAYIPLRSQYDKNNLWCLPFLAKIR